MKKSVIILLFLSFATAGFSQLVPGGIIHAFEVGDAKELSNYMSNNIELKILEEINVASKNQAVRLLQDFFKSNKPTSFSVSYEGSKKDSRYGMGTLKTKKGNFKVNLYFMDGGKKKLIYYLSIEKSE